MEIIFKYFWIAFIISTTLSALRLKSQTDKLIRQNPEVKKGAANLFPGLLIFGNLPWVIMGVGILLGMTQSVFDYLKPGSVNPIVLTFYASILLIWLLGFRWIYFKKGAEFIEAHPEMFKRSNRSNTTELTAKQIKRIYPLIILGVLIGMGMFWFMGPQFAEF